MLFSILLGFCLGIIGFIPLIVALRISRKAILSGLGASVGVVLLCIAISICLFIACILVFNDMHHDLIVPFVLSAAITLSIFAIGYGLYVQIKK